jgi:hypothetical protein
VVLVREAVQNSWDARAGQEPVRVALALKRVSAEERSALRDEVFVELPPKGVFGQALEGAEVELSRLLVQPDLHMLTITDRGTTGLGGPVRADRPPEDDGDSTDFVDLVFNIGQPPDKDLGGGTYGFGKTISYLLSVCRTVIIHTSTRHKGHIQQRLIVQTIGRQYTYRRRNFTGRHWWGVEKADDAIEPLTGDGARRLAARLGLPAFSRTETGTTIAILGPDLGGFTPHQVANFMAEAIAWNFWPKMIADAGLVPSMSFAVSVDGTDIPVPDPRLTPPLAGFAKALDAVRACDEGAETAEFPMHHIRHVKSQRPIADLGWLAMLPFPSEARTPRDCGMDDHGQPKTAASFTGSAHHVAVMRRAELVVQYRPGPALANKALEWAGVFRTSTEVDGAFAAAEPPTHDDWRPNLVTERRQRTYVNVAAREIKSAAESAFAPVVSTSAASTNSSGVVIADHLGELLSAVPGTGPSRRVPRPGRQRAASPVAKIVVARRWLEAGANGEPELRVEFSVIPKQGSFATVVEAHVGVAGPDGLAMEKDPPLGAPVPSVLGYWKGSQRFPGDTLQVPADDPSSWCLRIHQPADTATVVDLRVEPLDGAA